MSTNFAVDDSSTYGPAPQMTTVKWMMGECAFVKTSAQDEVIVGVIDSIKSIPGDNDVPEINDQRASFCPSVRYLSMFPNVHRRSKMVSTWAGQITIESMILTTDQ
jgi:hypothetical protein